MEVNLIVDTSVGPVHCKYCDRKSSDVIIMIHGLGGTRNSLFYRDMAVNATKSTCRFDFPGHGNSPGIAEIQYSKQALLVRQLKLFLQQTYNCASFTLVGHSKGATVAILAADHRDTIISLAGRLHLSFQPKNRYSPDQLAKIELGETLQMTFGRSVYFINKDSFEERKQLEGVVVEKVKEAVDVVIVHGSADEVINCEESRELAKMIGKECFIVEGRGHSDITWNDVKEYLGKWV
ncbi:Alpha/beta_hydrolase family protein [Hexamita inflata]|uniref:Alpha/beta hydrolase family protein n=1 Tax=Hexamita inflata TaxID=28002 RepID=A0AA86NJC4_9EUKA|nr:Alpha/beta hydrolase family protein [Hexamita inflata]